MMSSHLKTLRKRIGVSIGELAGELADRVGESSHTLVMIEDHDHIPTAELKEKIANAIGFDVGVIWPKVKPEVERLLVPLNLG